MSSGASLSTTCLSAFFLLRFRLVLFGSCILLYVCASLSWNINCLLDCFDKFVSMLFARLPVQLFWHCTHTELSQQVMYVHRLFQNCNHKVPSQQVMYVHVVSSTGPQGVIIILNPLSLSFHLLSFFRFFSRHSHYNHTPTWSVQVISEDYRFGQLFYLVTMATLDQR